MKTEASTSSISEKIPHVSGLVEACGMWRNCSFTALRKSKRRDYSSFISRTPVTVRVEASKEMKRNEGQSSRRKIALKCHNFTEQHS